MPKHILFDNSALNYVTGQAQHGKQISDEDRASLTAHMRKRVASGEIRVLVNVLCLGELSAFYFAPRRATPAQRAERRGRFDAAVRFLFDDCAALGLRPSYDDRVRPWRVAHEVRLRGRMPMDQALLSSKEWGRIRRIFVEAKRDAMDRFASDARQRKDSYKASELARRTDLRAAMNARALPDTTYNWRAVFKSWGWDLDPSSVVDQWMTDHMERTPRSYGLPKADRSAWPAPRQLVSPWHMMGYHVARLHEIFVNGVPHDDGGDLFDAAYFEDASYADTFVATDERFLRRVRSLRLPSPRIMSTDEWVAEELATPR